MILTRRDLLRFIPAAALPALVTAAEQDPLLDQRDILQAPDDAAGRDAWRRWLHDWRAQAKARLGYSGALYDREEFSWVPSSYSCCFLMMCDEQFYDRAAGQYTVARFLDDAQREFGGYDSMVLWHAYPRIGLDDRNQFDFYRDMPGGLEGLREVASQCHARGVRIYIDYNPWDRGTRREGIDDLDALASLVKAVAADGIFLDTMSRGASDFRTKLDAVRKGVVLEGEGALPLANIHDHHMSWAQWFEDSAAPGVLRNKWFERRHMQHQIDRFSRDHSAELHTAWMNGSGMMVWENVFGTWVGWNRRDRSIYRSMLPVQRRYARLFSGEAWTPLVNGTGPPDVYASLWEGAGVRLWTVVNRRNDEVRGPVLRVEPRPGERIFELITGRELTGAEGGQLRALIPPRGIAALLSAPQSALGSDFPEFLQRQRQLHAAADYSTEFPHRPTVLVPARRAQHTAAPPGMIKIGAARYRMSTQFRIRELGFYESTHPHFATPGHHKLHVPIWFERIATVGRLAIDETPVTNAQFAAFLAAGGYKPRQAHNFLRHWSGGTPPPGKGDHPVVWVDLDDARAYAKWAGKRLPFEEEWQYAAQGNDGREWPWGDKFDPERCNGGAAGGTTSVRAYPEGRSPFGVYDMCGNTWEWTESERTDGRTRFAILRGGSWYEPKGSDWYMDGGPKPTNFASKMLLMWAGLDRCGTVGFRCVVDLV